MSTTEELAASTMRANFAVDNPVFDKASMLGGKTDMHNKKMIKYGLILMGFMVGLIVVWLLVRVRFHFFTEQSFFFTFF